MQHPGSAWRRSRDCNPSVANGRARFPASKYRPRCIYTACRPINWTSSRRCKKLDKRWRARSRGGCVPRRINFACSPSRRQRDRSHTGCPIKPRSRPLCQAVSRIARVAGESRSIANQTAAGPAIRAKSAESEGVVDFLLGEINGRLIRANSQLASEAERS